MTISQTEIQSQVIELSTEASGTFCEDISSMFGIDMGCQHQEVCFETTSKLSKKFKKLAAITSVKASGILDGTFYVVFDKEGLFTLAGTIVMQPEQKIIDNRKRGDLTQARDLNDALGEAGNLLVGSWDRIFRENMESHGHFLQGGTFIGNPWENSKNTIGLASDEDFFFIPCQMTIGAYPSFNYGIIFPKTLFEKKVNPDSVSSGTKEEIPVEEEPIAQVEEKAILKEEAVIPKEPEVTAVVDISTVQEKNNVAPTEPKADVTPIAVAPIAMSIPETIQKMVNSAANLPGGNNTISLSVCARDVMQTEVLWVSPEDSVQQAMAKMQQSFSGYLMVGTDGKLEGIVSISDLNAAVSIYLRPMFAKWRRPLDDATLQIKLKWIMSRIVHTSMPETPLVEIMEKMFRLNCLCLPVVDQQGKFSGIITAFDIFESLMNPNSLQVS